MTMPQAVPSKMQPNSRQNSRCLRSVVVSVVRFRIITDRSFALQIGLYLLSSYAVYFLIMISQNLFSQAYICVL